MSHWHLSLGENDENSGTALELSQLLDSLADEFDRLADFVHDLITSNGEAGFYEAAYREFKRAATISVHAANARNLHKQHTCPIEERAPRYRDSDESENQRNLALATEHFLTIIMTERPGGITIWECDKADCPPPGNDD